MENKMENIIKSFEQIDFNKKRKIDIVIDNDIDNEIDIDNDTIIETYNKLNLVHLVNLEMELFSKNDIDFVSFPKKHYDSTIEELIELTDDMIHILKTFFIVNHKYVCLHLNNSTHPVFFIVLNTWNNDDSINIRCVKHLCYLENEDYILVKPLWNTVWMETSLKEDCIFNCMPFDESREYKYTNNNI